MKTVYIYNPKAGKGKNNFEKKLMDVKRKSSDAEVYTTKMVGDTERIIKDYYTKTALLVLWPAEEMEQ